MLCIAAPAWPETYPTPGTVFRYELTRIAELPSGAPGEVRVDIEEAEILSQIDEVIYFSSCLQRAAVCYVLQTDLISSDAFDVVASGRADPMRFVEAAHKHYREVVPYDPGSFFPLEEGKTITWKRRNASRSTFVQSCCAVGDDRVWRLSLQQRYWDGSVMQVERHYDPDLGWIVWERVWTDFDLPNPVLHQRRLIQVVRPDGQSAP